MNKLVVMDIDGVLADFEGKLVSVLAREFGEIAYYNRDRFRLEDRYGKYPQVLNRALELTKDPNFYYGLEECEGATDFVDRLSDEQYSITYASSRPKTAESFTIRWLFKHTIGRFGVYCGVADKLDFV